MREKSEQRQLHETWIPKGSALGKVEKKFTLKKDVVYYTHTHTHTHTHSHKHIHIMEYYSAIKKNESMPFAATGMDLEIVILREVSQKDKYHTILFICGTYKKMIQMNLYTKQKCS